MSIFDKWDKKVDSKALSDDVQEVEKNGGFGEYEEVPTGKYEVNIEKMEIKETKNGDPMFSCWMRILAGEFENKLLFYNQVITKGFQIALVNKFLRSLETGIDVDSFVGYREYNNLIMDIHEAIDDAGLEYMIEYSKNKKDYPIYTIKEVFEG